jgi:hypothetical protein
LNDELFKIGSPLTLGVQELDLIASSTIIVRRRSRDGVEKVGIKIVVDGSMNHIVREEHHMWTRESVIVVVVL